MTYTGVPKNYSLTLDFKCSMRVAEEFYEVYSVSLEEVIAASFKEDVTVSIKDDETNTNREGLKCLKVMIKSQISTLNSSVKGNPLK